MMEKKNDKLKQAYIEAGTDLDCLETIKDWAILDSEVEDWEWDDQITSVD